ncbi:MULTISPECIES: Hsp70 family protein [unclassified Devosia]|uniref:Hsp70 family protein n=1 Tax=unclassified Devosia TaxID=196773 RepID=UPI0015562ECC|nr:MULTISPECIES: Hsp70 family protein [unclassified Devosia]
MIHACGLDFGTSNSTFARVDANGVPHLLPLEGANETIPSVLFFPFDDEPVQFGRAAVAQYVSGAEGRLMRSLKSVLGTSLFAEKTRIKARSMGFDEILGIFIAELKRRAELALGEPVEQVVLGRPVQFVDDDPVADRQAQDQLEAAARAQGFAEIAFQFEPIAAALDFERGVVREQLALIVDLGGGTSDFSLVRVGPERARRAERGDDILATGGVHLGGTDFDRLLAVAKVMPHLGLGTQTKDGKRFLPVAPYHELATWHRINRLYTTQSLRDLRGTAREAREPQKVEALIGVVEDRLGHQLVGAVEAAKIALSSEPETRFSFPVRDGSIETDIGSGELFDILAGSGERLERAIAEVLRQAGVGPEGIDSLILTGGSTQVPAIAGRLEALFPQAELVRTNVLGSVGLGLALDAARRFGPAC